MHQLSLDLSDSKPTNQDWFQQILATLEVKQETGWTDNFGKSLRQYLTQQGVTPVKTLSLFSGGGGLDIAFHDSGFEIIQMIELEAKYIQTLSKNSQPGKWLAGSKPICTDMNFHPQREVDSFWRVVQCITRCIGTAAQLTTTELAEQWGVMEQFNLFKKEG